jgi:hypothetical protein
MDRDRSNFVAVAALVVLPLCGCHVSTHKNGNNSNVDVGTPFGSVQVKTNDNVNDAAIGITPYPGAVSVKNDDNNKSADVNIGFGNFHLGVKAASFQTSDDRDKVVAFYKHDLARYGDVLECEHNESVDGPERTSEGLACNENKDTYPRTIHIGSGLELRAGSPQREHIVSVETKNGGTRIGLVSLELPSSLTNSRDKKAEE